MDQEPGQHESAVQLPWPSPPPPRRRHRWYHVVLELVVLVVVIPAVVGAISNAVDGSESNTREPSSPAVGACVVGEMPSPTRRTAAPYSLVSCGEPHAAEVFAQLSNSAASDAEYPGSLAVGLSSDRGCLHAFWDYFGGYEKDSAYDVIVVEPNADTWAAGDRTTTCLVAAKDGSQPEGSSKGRGVQPMRSGVREKGVDDLTPGDCFTRSAETGRSFTELIVNCAVPHNQEVFYVFDAPPSSYPGDAAIEQAAKDRCARAFEDYAGIDFQRSPMDGLYWLKPGDSNWQFGDRRFTCEAGTTNNTTGSVKHAS